ncbi:MAG: DoxX family protein [Puniceicoccaceae bacterium 5H]|nr:MAG: DoxX family protein [Puniceicoccaceae bacterium 5H]
MAVRTLTVILRLFAALVFIASGALKLLDPGRFMLDVLAFQLFPYDMAYVVALTLPWVEVLGGLALLTGLGKRGAVLVLTLLTAGFITLLLVANAHGIVTDCGCFGDWLVFPNMATHIAFNCGLIFALVWLGWRWSRRVPVAP